MQGLVGPLANAFNRVAAHLMLDGPGDDLARSPDLRDSVEQAKLEWLCARDYFNHVTDPELVDYAIYQVKAAERRYMYLLGLARGDYETSAVGISPPVTQ